MHKIVSKLPPVTNFTDHEFRVGHGAEAAVTSPWSGEVISRYHQSTKEDIADVVDSAQTAFSSWSQKTLKERCQYLFNWRQILLRDLDLMSQVVSLESGKTVVEARAGLLKGIEVLEFALSLSNLDSGASMEVSSGVECRYQRTPLGVVTSITPFNFPAMVPMWTIPIAITLGNAMVWKPSDKTPITSMYLAASFKEAGFPKGVFSVVQGGASTVNELLSHPKIRAVSFVGSSKVAKIVYAQAAAAGKRVLALGGAKNHIFLFPDAPVEFSAKAILDSFTGCAGQRCMAASVLIAVGNVEEHLLKLKEFAENMKLGPEMGAIITAEQKKFLEMAIERALQSKAKLLVDGRKKAAPSEFSGGNWLGPTILDQVNLNSEALCQELFGPVLSIVRVNNLEEALKVEQASPYGNAASVFTSSGAVAEIISKRASSNMIGINVGVPVPREPFSFGGMGESKFGHGDITGESSLNFWTEIRKITSKWQTDAAKNWMS
jgi:malonate-semialdehyde dehydrogenase (acetylating) / methylmalonate-semialdehyde dehydrogenase